MTDCPDSRNPPGAEILHIMDERDKRYDQRADAQDRALVLASDALNKRIELLNEFRALIESTFSTMMTRTEFRVEQKSMEVKMDGLAEKINGMGGEKKGFSELLGWIVAAVMAWITWARK